MANRGDTIPAHHPSDRPIGFSRLLRYLVLALLAILVLGDGQVLQHQGHPLGWAISASVMVLFLARGEHLGRPITGGHAALAVAGLLASFAADMLALVPLGFVLLALSGAVLLLPTPSRPNPELLPQMAFLVDQTPDDPLAPFALHSAKSYFVGAAGQAAIAYRTAFGIAVVGGDPIGRPEAQPQVAAEFVRFCRAHGWRLAVLGASERGQRLWSSTADLTGTKAVPFGRDVVLDIPGFELAGRRFRNLRQAVNRARNAGVTTEIVSESELPATLRAELLAVMNESGRRNRGFSMILDRPLEGRIPGLVLVVGRDRSGQVVGFARYACADHGRMISLDLPWRRRGAPNGIDEAMTMAMLDWAASHGGRRLSLSLAAFPELFDQEHRRLRHRIAHRLVHLGDPLIAVESLYDYLRKYHALAGRRFVLFGWTSAVFAVLAFLTLEFVPHRRQRAAVDLGVRAAQGTIADVLRP